MKSSNKLTNDILEVLNSNENIISSSIVGSIIEKDIADIADIDIVVILDQVSLKKISQIKNDLLNLSPLDYRIKKIF
jgi:predicted nucleotidyltransferase